MKNAFLLAIAFCCITTYAYSLDRTMRESVRLYQIGRYEQAIETAQRVYRYFPGDVQALVIMGAASFHQKDYLEARRWLRKAIRLEPDNMLAQKYIQLLKDVEYKFEPLGVEPANIIRQDRIQTAREFERAWFGPSFPVRSKTPKQEPMPQISRPGVAGIPHPAEVNLERNHAVARLAKNALENENYYKAYLFFSQLLKANLDNRTYLVGKAEAAFHLGRYREVMEILGPYLASDNPLGFMPSELIKARHLLQQSRANRFE